MSAHSFRLNEELSDQFNNYCDSLGIKKAELLKELVTNLVTGKSANNIQQSTVISKQNLQDAIREFFFDELDLWLRPLEKSSRHFQYRLNYIYSSFHDPYRPERKDVNLKDDQNKGSIFMIELQDRIRTLEINLEKVEREYKQKEDEVKKNYDEVIGKLQDALYDLGEKYKQLTGEKTDFQLFQEAKKQEVENCQDIIQEIKDNNLEQFNDKKLDELIDDYFNDYNYYQTTEKEGYQSRTKLTEKTLRKRLSDYKSYCEDQKGYYEKFLTIVKDENLEDYLSQLVLSEKSLHVFKLEKHLEEARKKKQKVYDDSLIFDQEYWKKNLKGKQIKLYSISLRELRSIVYHENMNIDNYKQLGKQDLFDEIMKIRKERGQVKEKVKNKSFIEHIKEAETIQEILQEVIPDIIEKTGIMILNDDDETGLLEEDELSLIKHELIKRIKREGIEK